MAIVEERKYDVSQFDNSADYRWIEDFLRQGGFEIIVNVLKGALAIEWRNEKDDAVLHQILLCLKALSTTEVHPHHITLIVGWT